jgi:hypothetical protein
MEELAIDEIPDIKTIRQCGKIFQNKLIIMETLITNYLLTRAIFHFEVC